MKRVLVLFLIAALFLSLTGCAYGSEPGELPSDDDLKQEGTVKMDSYNPDAKTRVINITDLLADPDDEQSLVRMLVTSDQIELEGIIVSTSCFRPYQDQSAMDRLNKITDAYGEALPNLQIHSSSYPSVEYIKSISVMGQTGYSMGDVGEGKDSDGSELIIAAVDEDDDRPIWINLWGGGNTLAQALWKVKNTRSEEDVAEFVSKIRVYDVLGQDEAGAWIVTNFPELLYIRANLVYGLNQSITEQGEEYIDSIQSMGALGAVYPDAAWAYEGDSPSFMYQLPTGMNDPEHIDWGSWGGRFSLEKKENIKSMDAVENEGEYQPYYMYGDAQDAWDSIVRWGDAAQNDFLARMIWSVTDNYDGANHHPVAVLNGDETLDTLEINASAGEVVTLSAEGSYDPDGDKLSYSWFSYSVPSEYTGVISIDDNEQETASFTVPENASGKSIHIILEIHDNGSPSLYAYRRIIINVA